MPGRGGRPRVPVRVLVLTGADASPYDWPDASVRTVSLRSPRQVARWVARDSPRPDVVVSGTPRLDPLATLAARLVGALGVGHAAAAEAHDRVAALVTALDDVTEHLSAGHERLPPPDRLVERLRSASADVLGSCPDPLVPVDLVAAHARSWVGPLPHQFAAQLVTDAFLGLPWPPARVAPSGLAARLEWARLSTDPEPGAPADRVRAAAAAAVDGSTAAWEAALPELALGRWGDAWELLYHRELHTDVGYSPLVDDPRRWLAPLLAAPVPAALVRHHVEGPRHAGPGTDRDRPSVVVATGLSGAFHQGVTDALAPVADVETLDVISTFPRLRRHGRPSVAALRELAATRGLLRDSRQSARAQRLRDAVAGCDVVFSDWADASTVWLSYVCPPEVRLVVRVHSVDAIDAWFPLVDWVNVDEVVVSPALRSLVVELLETRGIRSLPVTVLPPLVGIRDLGPEKEDGARHTLGMIGWARRVKDVAWALDLLEQDPAWRLVLVGHPLTEPRGSARSRAYHAEVLERLQRPDLASRVEVAGWSDDVSGPLRRIGVILSTSRRESLHYGLVEGAASGAVPVVRDWPVFAGRGGARAVYPKGWVVDTVEQAAARIRETTVDEETWEAARLAAREEARALFDPDRAAEQYRATVLGR